ncbi:hypothetical protein BOTCAL_0207g00040 [Botryotinia calthae]|uniref:Apple domain-containing protein n=1 Tax=Botryotinia calthae TaxID=38488 RepID=A0A4Y8CYX4_9HELO|nr:hypothetical protein BOTCAL_0207g00040 [Botryotinia calthae]
MCSTECPYANGQQHVTAVGEAFRMDCGMRHGTAPIYMNRQNTLRECIEGCGKLSACRSVDYDKNRKICYHSDHIGPPAISASGFDSAYSTGYAGACGSEGCGGCSKPAPVAFEEQDTSPFSQYGANSIVDPDGDLILLLNPIILDSLKSDSPSPADPEAINTLDDDMSKELQMIRDNEGGFSETSQDEPTPIYNDHILVSSKHMSLASPVFKAMLQGGFKEAITLKMTGKLELPLPDDDPAAMKILIDMIHGRMKLIPLKINLELFTKLAILVDKYQCAEITCPYPDIWKNTLQDWADSCEEMACWLCIAWQFELDAEFCRASTWIEAQGTCDLVTTMATMKSNLPIPKQVTDTIETFRIEGIRKAVKSLEDFIKTYQKPENRCTTTQIPEIEYKESTQRDPYNTFGYNSNNIQSKKMSFLDYNEVVSYRRDCDSMLLGSLTKSAIEHGLFPLPASPYTSWSLKSLRHKIELLEASSLCSRLLKTSVVKHDVIDGLKESICAILPLGLTLKDGKRLVRNK